MTQKKTHTLNNAQRDVHITKQNTLNMVRDSRCTGYFLHAWNFIDKAINLLFFSSFGSCSLRKTESWKRQNATTWKKNKIHIQNLKLRMINCSSNYGKSLIHFHLNEFWSVFCCYCNCLFVVFIKLLFLPLEISFGWRLFIHSYIHSFFHWYYFCHPLESISSSTKYRFNRYICDPKSIVASYQWWFSFEMRIKINFDFCNIVSTP